MLDGDARKIGLMMAAGTFIAWLLIVIAFALLTVDIGVAPIGSTSFPHWVISLGGLPLIGLAVHAAVSTRGAVRTLRAVTTFMSVIFLLSLGMLLYLYGTLLVAGVTTVHTIILFSGSLLATVAWTGQMVIWTFYQVPDGLIQ